MIRAAPEKNKQLACSIFLKAKSLQRSRQATNVVQAFTLQKNVYLNIYVDKYIFKYVDQYPEEK
ncbi:hypothetical protein C900_01257 [Fulvivirga imtechensis AK7]|uniref:Uncharacterized protein n=2 Tax=Fulvivirga TaxID=396811 RepID=L8JGS8_9BACT|nr:hypothetical protein C900_01257 [Fulvivirga imtechensis AK7]